MQWLKSEGVDADPARRLPDQRAGAAWRKGFGLTWKDYGGDVALQRLGANFAEAPGPHPARHARHAR